jgi:hypothetical protein
MMCAVLLMSVILPMQSAVAAKPNDAPVREFKNHTEWPVARSADVASPRSVVLAFFEAISAAKGGTLDRERLRSLFVPDGRVEIPIPASGTQATDVVFMRPEQYAEMSDGATKSSGFFDHALAMQTEQFGVMGHVYAAYESRTDPKDAKPFVRGMKSFELLERGGRWYIVQVSWDREREGLAIPEGYLHDHP